MATTIAPETLYFGTPVSLTVGGVEVGATTEPPTVEFEVEEYTPEFQGAGGPVRGTKIIRRIIPKANVTVNEITAAKMAWALAGSSSTASSTDELSGGAVTQLDGAVSAGDTVITVDSAAGIAVGNFLRIGAAGPTADYREVTAVNGLDITLDHELGNDHADNTSVTETEGVGSTTITSEIGRLASTEYRDVVLLGEGLDGRQIEVTIFDAASAENIELPFADDAIGGFDIVLVGHYDPATPRVAPYQIVLL
jgi:hypothetical protein